MTGAGPAIPPSRFQSPIIPEIASSRALLAMTAKSGQKSTHRPAIASLPVCLATIVVKGVQREIPVAGDWGCPPDTLIPPLLEERGLGGEVNGDSDNPLALDTETGIYSDLHEWL